MPQFASHVQRVHTVLQHVLCPANRVPADRLPPEEGLILRVSAMPDILDQTDQRVTQAQKEKEEQLVRKELRAQLAQLVPRETLATQVHPAQGVLMESKDLEVIRAQKDTKESKVQEVALAQRVTKDHKVQLVELEREVHQDQ